MQSTLREFVRDLILRTMEKTRGEVSQGIQDAVVPIVTNFVTVLLCIFLIVLVLFLIPKRGGHRW